MRGMFVFFTIFFISLNAYADRTSLQGNFTQGGLIIGVTEPDAVVFFEGKQVAVSPSGRFLFGFGRDFKPTALLKIRYVDGGEEEKQLNIEKREYKVERVNGLPPSKVTPSAEFLKRIRKENAEIARIRSVETQKEWFLSGWQWPAVGRVSGVYGSQRILNDIPKRPHFGVDIAAPEGTPVVASTDGLIQMAEEDLYYTGGTVMIDHGYGLVSVYSHLSKLDVMPGQFVRQGERIGEVGSTGRSTGPHLDWRINWFSERLDPELLLGAMPIN
ncbi:M23 family metallopeptidase [Sneathiella sp. HT1-7]|uniref:M23 family metallopeptidase n=1 Tax=Sneathiella sp. HT1-7 TaxID=2887192 RepID=UPI001D14B308|nr:M23 family metallopeptidase [Sneathiella sp. HT1-7]MCC3303436.1 M23 family metallopeptidase [Sneathiella sp. HT1-7]